MEFQLPTSTGEPDFFHQQCVFHFFVNIVTLPETNIAPKNRPSQKDTSIPIIHFQVLCSFREIVLANGSKIRGSKK